MYLKKSKYKNGRTFLSICKKFREDGKIKETTVKKIGYLDEVDSSITDPISFYTDMAKKLTADYNLDYSTMSISVDLSEQLDSTYSNIFNLGYLFPPHEYHRLSLDSFLQSKQKKLNIQYNLNAIFRMLVLSRIINPRSNLKTYKNTKHFFENVCYSLDDISFPFLFL